MSDFINNFLNIFPTLSKFQKKAFKYLQWFAQKFRCVFPCLQKIANAIGCSKATVMRATSLFEKLGWIAKKKRGYCSNTYFMNDELISLNLKDEKIFLREECKVNATVFKESFPVYIDTSTSLVPVSKSPISEEQPILDVVKIKCLKVEDQQKLSNKFSEYSLVQAIQDAKWYARQGRKILSYIGLIYSRAKFYQNQYLK